MGCDYYAHIYIGVDAKNYLKHITKTVELPVKVNGVPAYKADGTPMTKTTAIRKISFMGKEYTDIYDIEILDKESSPNRDRGLLWIDDSFSESMIGINALETDVYGNKDIDVGVLQFKLESARDWLESIGINEDPKIKLVLRVSC